MIKIICVGSLKEQYLKDLVNDYYKRINKYHKLEIIEVKDSDILEEGNLILKNIKQNEYIICLSINGKDYDTLSFTDTIDKTMQINSNITFVIGGSNGISNKVIERSDKQISFSKLTFPHGLFRGILLEQIYRSFKILNNESYHK